MRIVRFATAFLLAALVASGLASAGPPAPSPYGRWPDAQHGWQEYGNGAKCDRDLCSTADGGKTWRGIFNGGTFLFGFLQTSRSAGFVTTGRIASGTFWTRDGGRHWYATDLPAYAGSGGLLFGVRDAADGASQIVQIHPWPPAEPVDCRAWADSAFGAPTSTTATARENVCVDGIRDAGMVVTPIARIDPTDRPDGLENLPGGVTTFITRDGPAGPIVEGMFGYRLGTEWLAELPAARRLVREGLHVGRVALRIAWPDVFAVATLEKGDAEVGEAIWHSADGGFTFPATLDPPHLTRPSWIDSEHGWRRSGPECGAEGPRVALCATDDGGASWRATFRAKAIGRIAMTSAAAGIVRAGTRTYWTRDGGSHWTATPAIGSVFGGSAGLVFAADGPHLYRLSPWPPRGSAVTRRPVLRLEKGRFADLAPVPAGVAGLVLGGAPRPQVLVLQPGRRQLTTLPRAPSLSGAARLVMDPRLKVAWQDLFVTGRAVDEANVPVGEVVWHSADAGAHWQAVVAEGPGT